MSESVISFAGREQGQPAMPHSVCGVNHKVLPLVDKALHTPNPHYQPPSVVFLDPEAKQVLAVVTYEREFEKRSRSFADALDRIKGKY